MKWSCCRQMGEYSKYLKKVAGGLKSRQDNTNSATSLFCLFISSSQWYNLQRTSYIANLQKCKTLIIIIIKCEKVTTEKIRNNVRSDAGNMSWSFCRFPYIRDLSPRVGSLFRHNNCKLVFFTIYRRSRSCTVN